MQRLRENRRAKTSWRCYDCSHSNKISFIVVALILGLSSIGLIYADEQTINIPFEFWNTHFCTFMGFPLENGTTLYEYECVWTGWENMIQAGWEIDNPTATIPLPLEDAPEAFIIIPPEHREDQPAPETEEERIERLKETVKEKRAELDAETEQLIGKLAECRTGLGAFGAYQENEAIQDYANKTRWQFAIRDNLSQNMQVGTILKAIEECRIMKRYADMNLIGDYELNKILADMAGVDYLGRLQNPEPRATDQSDSSVFTDPLTERDFEKELEEMEKIRDETFRDPNADFNGTNRGFQPAGLKCQTMGQPAPVGIYATQKCPLSNYEAHILKNWDNITYKDILTLQCDNFLYIYQHKIGTDDFPVWLNHCVPRVVLE